MKKLFLHIILAFGFLFLICSCSTSIRICSNKFEKHEARYYIQNYYKKDTINYQDYYETEDTIRKICKINIQYPSISGLRNKTMEDSINCILKDIFLDWSDCGFFENYLDNMHVDIYVRFKVSYVSNNLISIISYIDAYRTTIITYNIDLRNGKLLTINDILKPVSQQKLEEKILKIWLRNQQEDEERFKLCEGYDFYSNFNVAFTKNTVFFIFNRSGLCGPFMIEIKKQEVKNIIKSKFL